jgi:hypothetical protein
LLVFSAPQLEILGKEIEFLQNHVVIVCFSQGELLPAAEFSWVIELRRMAASGRILFHHPVGGGFLYLRTDRAETTWRVLF